MHEGARHSESGQVTGERPSGRGVVRALEAPGAERLGDAAVVELVRRGDRRGAALLYDRFAPLVRRLVARTFGPEEDASDLVQEVLIAVVQGIDTLREPTALRSFVYGVTVNLARMELRRRSRRRFVVLGWGPGVEAAAAANVEEPRQAAAELYHLLGELGDEARLLFVLRYVEGLPLAEVATLMGSSLATAKRRLSKATRLVWARARAVPELAWYLRNRTEPPAPAEDARPVEEARHG